LKISFIDLIRSAFGKRDEKFRQRLTIFFVCLLISVIIWFTLKLSDDYDTVIQMPVTFTHIPKNKVLTFVSDTTLQVEIIEKGSNLFRILYVEKPGPVSISLRFLPVYPKGGIYQGIITPSLFLNEIEREQNLLGKIVSISPDTIYLSFEPERSRKLPVTADFDLTFEKQFMRYGAVDFIPDSVVVKGPERIVDRLDSASLGKIRLEQLDKPYTGSGSFQGDSLNHFLSFSPGSVTYNIPVEKYTEAEMDIPVKIINSGGLEIKTFPDKVKIFYTVALKDFAKMEAGMIIAVADISAINVSEDDKIRVSIESSPSYIHINKMEPEKVEFIIIK
jgi:hypothetical protein